MLTQTEVTRLLDIANAGLHKGAVSQARTIYEGVLAGHPGHVPTLISLALSHIVVDDFAKADEILAGVLEGNPEDDDALVYLGLSQKLQQKTDEARETLGRVDPETTAGKLAASLLETL